MSPNGIHLILWLGIRGRLGNTINMPQHFSTEVPRQLNSLHSILDSLQSTIGNVSDRR